MNWQLVSDYFRESRKLLVQYPIRQSFDLIETTPELDNFYLECYSKFIQFCKESNIKDPEVVTQNVVQHWETRDVDPHEDAGDANVKFVESQVLHKESTD